MGEETQIRPRKKRATVRGNLIKLALVFLVFGVVAVGARLVNREPTLILPEMMDRAADTARRASPDNALYGLREARQALPAPDGAIEETIAAWAGRIAEHGWPEYTPTLDRFIHFDDPHISAYLDASVPSLDLVHEAVRKPYFLLEEPDTFFLRRAESFPRLALSLVARGAEAGRVAGNAAEAAQRLGDAIRLSRMLVAEDSNQLRDRGIEDEALRQVILSLQQIQDVEGLRILSDTLQELGAPWPDPYLALQRYWRKLDDTLSYVPTAHQEDDDQPIRRIFFLREIQYWAKSIIPHKAFYRELAAAPAAAHDRMVREYGEIDTGWRARRWKQLQRHPELLRKAAYTSLYYARAVLAVALAGYRASSGSYPASLEALVPTWIAAIPEDPVSGAPFVYRRDGESYALYSVGMNGLDDGGNDESDLWMMKPGW